VPLRFTCGHDRTQRRSKPCGAALRLRPSSRLGIESRRSVSREIVARFGTPTEYVVVRNKSSEICASAQTANRRPLPAPLAPIALNQNRNKEIST